MKLEQKLQALRQTTDETLSGLRASQGGAYAAWKLAQQGGGRRQRSALRVAVPALALCLIVLFAALGLPALRPGTVPAVESIPAGDPALTAQQSTRADLPQGSVTLSGGGAAFRNLFAGSSVTDFPMIQSGGQYYRMLNSPQSLARRYLGGAIGTVSLYTDRPSSFTGGISSNAVLEGETVYAVADMEGAAVAANVNGSLRVFQRVSLNGQGTEGSLSAVLGHARVTEISVSGIGRVTDAGTIQRLFRLLTGRSAYLSGACSETAQGLYLTMENGVTLQLYLSGSTAMACGAWSCAEFLDEFRQVAR